MSPAVSVAAASLFNVMSNGVDWVLEVGGARAGARAGFRAAGHRVGRGLLAQPAVLARERLIADRQAAFGPNRLSQARQRGVLSIFLQQFNQPLVYILLLAGLVTAGLQHWVDTSVIVGVVVINAIIGAMQESRALRAIEALSLAMTSQATVLRGGIRQRIPAEALVPGDIVLLQSGDKVPADLRLLDVRSLRIDESALTGESLAVEKQTGELAPEVLLPDRLNMVYGSTLVSFGTGRGVVVATGDDTEIGRISALIASTEVLATPLTRRLARFSRALLYAILVLAALTFGIGILHGESWFEMFMAAVALAVSAIPEGLPAGVAINPGIRARRTGPAPAPIRHPPARAGPARTGTDYTPALTRGCRATPPFAPFDFNGLAPPLPHAAGSFDFVYAFSVFTHLSEAAHERCLSALHAGLRPGGALVVTIRPPAYLHESPLMDPVRDREGEPFIFAPHASDPSHPQYAGPEMHYGEAVIALSYVREKWARWFELTHVDLLLGDLHQVALTLRRRG